MKKDNMFWGVLFIIGALFIIISKLGLLGDVNGFSIFLSVILVGAIIRNIFKFHISGLVFPIAFLAIIYDKQLGIEELTPWTVLIAAFLFCVGFSMIFGKRSWDRFKDCKCHGNIASKTKVGSDPKEDGCIYIDRSFGEDIKYINTNDLQKVKINVSFGSVKVYFDNANIQNDIAIVDLDVSFGGVQLYVPREWRVINECSACFAGIDEKNRSSSVITKTIRLVGDVNFGGIDIYYV